jgi:sugar O-acyltransferase (sialic acid O-acetyltransferase NeuD family)
MSSLIPLVIFGASNAGDEYAQLFRDINAVTPTWDLLGFVDDNDALWGHSQGGLTVFSGTSWIQKEAPDNLHVVLAVGNVRAKRSIVARLRDCHVQFATGVHPSVITSRTNRIGAGTLVCPGVVLTTNVTVGDHVIVNVNTCIHHNTAIGDYCNINPAVAIAGDVVIENSVYIGIGANISDKVRIGRGAIIGGGAMVTTSIRPFATAVGVPAREIKVRENDLD